MAAVKASMFALMFSVLHSSLQECFVITGPLQDNMHRRSELKHKEFWPQISSIANDIIKTHVDPNTMIFSVTFLYAFSLIVKYFLLQLVKKSLTLNALGNCPDTRTASYFIYKCKFVANTMSLNWINTYVTSILVFFHTTGYQKIPSTGFMPSYQLLHEIH